MMQTEKRVKLSKDWLGREVMVRPSAKVAPQHHYKVGTLRESGYGKYAIDVNSMRDTPPGTFIDEFLGEFAYQDEVMIIPEVHRDALLALNKQAIAVRNEAKKLGVMPW